MIRGEKREYSYRFKFTDNLDLTAVPELLSFI
jgi:hypothetical protein